MTHELKELLIGSVSRIKNGKVPIYIWLLLIGTTIGSALSLVIAFLVQQILPMDVAKMVVPIIQLTFSLLTLVGYWKLTRSLADYHDRDGDVLPWIGWSILAYLPLLLIDLIVAKWSDGYLFMTTAVYIFVAPLVLPLLAHASGRAIDANGPDIGSIISYWLPRYRLLFSSYLIIVSPLIVVGSIVTYFVGGSTITIFATAVVAALVYLASSVGTEALAVEAFHRAEAANAA